MARIDCHGVVNRGSESDDRRLPCRAPVERAPDAHLPDDMNFVGIAAIDEKLVSNGWRFKLSRNRPLCPEFPSKEPQGGVYDSHPPPKERLAAVGQTPPGQAPAANAPGRELKRNDFLGEIGGEQTFPDSESSCRRCARRRGRADGKRPACPGF
jgi:hypothetical protein